MRDWGVKTMDSAYQIILFQRFMEECGGEPWSMNTLPPAVEAWILTLDPDSQECLDTLVHDGTNVSQAVSTVVGQRGAKATNDAKLAHSIQKTLAGGLYRVGVSTIHGRPLAGIRTLGHK